MEGDSEAKHETFEEWLFVCEADPDMEKRLIMLDRPLNDFDPPILGLSVYLTHLEKCSMEVRDNPLHIYMDFLGGANIAYYAAHTRNDEKSILFAEEIHMLCHYMFRIDTECGNPKALTPSMSTEEHAIGLAALDHDRELFKTIVGEAIEALKGHRALLEYFINFTRFLFRFNAYQGPYRFDAQKAMMDAAGLSDLHGEMLEELGYKDGKLLPCEIGQLYAEEKKI